MNTEYNMHLNGFPQNAECDMIAGRPLDFEVAQGYAKLRFNIEEKFDDETGLQTGWKYSEVGWIIVPTKTMKQLAKKAIINAMYSLDDEEGMKHDYDAVMAGVSDDDEAVDIYMAFLQFREDINTMLQDFVG